MATGKHVGKIKIECGRKDRIIKYILVRGGKIYAKRIQAMNIHFGSTAPRAKLCGFPLNDRLIIITFLL